MDPQSVAFVPHNESWRVHNELLRIQQIQADHTDRLLRLERRQDDDARMKSVWGGASPFPSVLSGTPQQGKAPTLHLTCRTRKLMSHPPLAPLHHPPNDQFKDFDDESANLIGSLHLDADEEPRRMGATSRANSVRFDESANQGHWSHAPRSSLDFMPRSSSSLGGIPMNERTSSHKSDGRASSVHSVRSAASGRASSLNLDAAYGLADPNRSPLETPGIAPGLLILGSVPSIIRCWLNTDFKHNALLYAAISSASHKSHLDIRLLQRLGFEDRIAHGANGEKTVQLAVYFPEAVPFPSSSRSGSPAPQVPTLTVQFDLVSHGVEIGESKSIQIFIGSDALRTHNADIMFSTNSMTLFDDDQRKLSIPLVRPEDEAVFKGLCTSNEARYATAAPEKADDTAAQPGALLNGLGQRLDGASETTKAATSSATSSSSGKYRAPGVVAAESRTTSPRRSEDSAVVDEAASNRDATPARPPLSISGVRIESKEATTETGSSQAVPAQTSPAIWNNWRKDAPSQNSQLDWTGTNKKAENISGTGGSGYQRRDTGIKVLKPMRTPSRTMSGATASPSSADGKSRFFDEGKRRSGVDGVTGDEKRMTAPPLSRKSSGAKDNQQSAGAGVEVVAKTRTNPIGGASAFSWLNPAASRP